MYEEVWGRGNVDFAEEVVFADDYVRHDQYRQGLYVLPFRLRTWSAPTRPNSSGSTTGDRRPGAPLVRYRSANSPASVGVNPHASK